MYVITISYIWLVNSVKLNKQFGVWRSRGATPWEKSKEIPRTELWVVTLKPLGGWHIRKKLGGAHKDVVYALEIVLGSKGSTGVSVLAEERRDQIGKI